MQEIKVKPLPGDDDTPWALAIIPGVGVVDLGEDAARELLANED